MYIGFASFDFEGLAVVYSSRFKMSRTGMLPAFPHRSAADSYWTDLLPVIAGDGYLVHELYRI